MDLKEKRYEEEKDFTILLSLLILCSSLQLPVDAKEMDASGKQDTNNMESEISVQERILLEIW